MSHISKQQAADRLGVPLECNWEQARTAYNLKVVHIHSAYPQPCTKQDEEMRADEIRPYYEALRLLFPIEVSQEPALKNMTVAPTTHLPSPPPQPVSPEPRQQPKARTKALSFTVQKVFLSILVGVALLFAAITIAVQVVPEIKALPSEPIVSLPDTVLVERPVPIVYVITSRLNIRDQPGQGASPIASLKRGEVLHFLNDKTAWTEKIKLDRKVYEDHWVKVRTESGIEGWVFGAFVHYYPKRL